MSFKKNNDKLSSRKREIVAIARKIIPYRTTSMRALLLSCMLCAPVMGSGLSYFSYVTNYGNSGNTVSVIDQDDKVISNILFPLSYPGPYGVAFSPDGSKVYVTNYNLAPGIVDVIRTHNNLISMGIGVGYYPSDVAFSPDGRKAYVTNYGDDTVSVIHTKRNIVIGAPITVGNGPSSVAFSPTMPKAYVTNDFSDTVSVVNTETDMITTSITVGLNPYDVAFSPDGQKAYVTNHSDNTFSVINTSNDMVSGTFNVGVGNSEPYGVAFNPREMKHQAYIVNDGSDTVSVIDTINDTVTTSITIENNPTNVAFSPDGQKAYVTNGNSDTVSVINTETNTVTNTISAGIGSGPFDVAFSPFFITGKYTTSGDEQMTHDGIDRYFISFAGGTLKASKNFKTHRSIYLSDGIAALFKSKPGGTINTHKHAITLKGHIFGPGKLTVIGKGELILEGKNTYEGGTDIKEGTLVIKGEKGSIKGPIYNNSTLVFDRDNNYTFKGEISGKGNLVQRGSGTLILKKENSYKGATHIECGTLQLQGDDVLPVSTDVIMNPGAIFDLGTFSQEISSLSGSGKVIFGNATLKIRDDKSTTFDGIISGTGSLIKDGKGTLTLSGKSTFSGSTDINEGVLNLIGSQDQSSVNVNKDAVLNGKGSMRSLNVTLNGTVSPGYEGHFGRLHVGGNTTQLDGTYVYKLNAKGRHDLIIDKGPITLGCGSVLKIKPQGDIGSYPSFETYKVLEGLCITGQFSTIKLSKKFRECFDCDVIYEPTEVLVTLHRKKGERSDMSELSDDRGGTIRSQHDSSSHHQKEKLDDFG